MLKSILVRPIAACLLSLAALPALPNDARAQRPPVSSATVPTPPPPARAALRIVKQVTDLNGGTVRPGDVLEYTITIESTGSANAVDVELVDAIPAHTTYLAGTLRIASGPNTGPKSDAVGDDQGSFIAAPARVRFLLGVDANAAYGGILEPGTSTEVAFRVAVDADAINGTQVSNQAFVTSLDYGTGAEGWAPSTPPGGPPEGAPTVVTVSVPEPPVTSPDLSMTKSAGVLVVGTTGTFTLSVANAGTAPTTGVITVTDDLPAGLTLLSGTGSGFTCSSSGQLVTCIRQAALGPGESASIVLTVHVGEAALPGITNSATVQTSGDTNPANDTGSVGVTPQHAHAPDISVVKSVVTPLHAGEQGTFRIRLTNVGSGPTTGPITLTDVLDPGLTFVSATGSGWTCSVTGQTVTCIYGALLGPGGITTVDLVVTVDAALTSVSNTVAGATPDDGVAGNDTSTVGPVPVTPAPPEPDTIDLTLAKQGPDSVAPGSQAVYTLTIRNAGTGPTTGPITVTDTLPAGLAFVSGAGDGFVCAAAGRVVTCTRQSPPLAAGGSAIVTITADVAPGVSGAVRNVACVNTPGDKGQANDCGETTAAAPGSVDLELTKDIAASGGVADPVSFRMTVRNLGTIAALPPLTLVDTLQSGLTFASAEGDGWQCAAAGQVVTCTRSTPLGAGEHSTVTLTVNIGPLAGAELRNCGDVRGVNETGPLTNNRSCVDRRVIGVGTLQVIKRASRAEAEIGDIVDYTIVVHNSGDAALTAVEVSDVLPEGFLLVAGTVRVNGTPTSQVSGAPGPRITILVGALAAGAEATVTYRVRISAGARVGDNTNVAVARSGEVASPPGRATVRIRGGVFEERGAIAGRISMACECPDGARLLGIPGVRVHLEDGTSAITDEEGKYSFTNVASRLHVVRVDRTTLPEGAVLAPLGNRNAGDAYSRFVDLKGGELHRADFAGNAIVPDVLDRVMQRRRAEESDGSDPTHEEAVKNAGFLVSGLVHARLDFSRIIRGGLGVSAGGDGFEEALRDWSSADDSGRVAGGARAAIFAKGRVLDNGVLTVAFDSERDRGRTFFRDITPDASYQVVGDAAIREYGAQSRRRFYVRLDKGASYTLFGDFQTGGTDDRRVLSAYDRRLTGAVQHLENGRASATVYASQGKLHQVVDELPGRGISGPYALTRATGLVNSERVEILVRDRNQPAVILSRTVMTRFADYTVETGTGRLIFRAPVPSVDANLNPVSVRVTYEAEDGAADAFWVYGVDASLKVTSGLEVGGTFAGDDHATAGHQLTGVNARARLGASTTLLGEFARVEHTGGTDGTARRIELRHQTGPLEARLFAIKSDRDFLNNSSAFSGGRTEAGTRVIATLADGTRLVGEALRTESQMLDGRRDGALLSVERRLTRALQAEIGYRYARESGMVLPPVGGLTPPTHNDVSAMRGRIVWTLPERTRTSFFGEVEQDVRRQDQHRAAVGGEYAISRTTRLYARHERLSAVDGPYAINQAHDQAYTVFGIDGDYLQNTQMFSEYRARDAFAGRDVEASIGLRNRWGVTPGLNISTSVERVSPLVVSSDAQGALAGKAFAVTGAVEWTGAELWKSTARVELRNASSGDNRLVSAGYARKLSRDVTVLGRTLWDDFDAARRETRGFTQAGLAWRQARDNRWNALARYEHRYEQLGALATAGASRDVAHVGAAIVNVQAWPRLTFSGRYAAKYATSRRGLDESSNTAQLLMGRTVFDLTSRLDAGLITSALFGDGAARRQYGLGGEAGVIVMRNVRVAGGYNLFGFTDRDLSSFGTTRRGAYIEFGFKFDEGLFGLGASDATPAARTGTTRE